jgi:hypothetical protein
MSRMCGDKARFFRMRAQRNRRRARMRELRKQIDLRDASGKGNVEPPPK